MDLKEKFSDLQKKYEEVEIVNRSLNGKLSEMFILYNLTRILGATFDLKQILTNIFRVFNKSLPIKYASLYLLDSIANSLDLNQTYGCSFKNDGNVIFPSNDILEKIMLNRNGGSIDSLTIDELADIQIADNYSIEFPLYYAGFPLNPNGQKTIGTLNFFRNGAQKFSEQEIDFLGRVSFEVSNILDKIIIYTKTREDTYLDHLTGAYNRRYFNQRFPIEFKRAERYKRNLSLLMIDIDHFKSKNDQYGHLTGDNILKNLVQITKEQLRKSDILIRYGGEEFIILLPETNMRNAIIVSEKLRKDIAKNLSLLSNLKNEAITISGGVSNYPYEAYSAESLVEMADKQLFVAKKNGRNRTVYSKNILT